MEPRILPRLPALLPIFALPFIAAYYIGRPVLAVSAGVPLLSLLRRRKPHRLPVLLGIAGSTFGFALQSHPAREQARSHWGLPAEQIQIYYGQVIRDSVPVRGSLFRFTVRAAAGGNSGSIASARTTVTVFADRSNPMPSLGQRVRLKGTVFRSVQPDGSVQWQSFLRRNSITITRTPNPLEMEQISALRLSYTALLQRFWQFRADLRNQMFLSLQRNFPARGRDLFTALLLGASHDLSPELKEQFQRSGTIHILALSGFHAGLLAGIVSLLLRPILGYRLTLIGSSLILLAYLFIVGFLPSLVRSVTMFLLLNTCRYFRKGYRGIHILLISALLQLCLFPESGFQLSFQLSYLSLLGLILFSGRCDSTCRIFWRRSTQAVLSAAPRLQRPVRFIEKRCAILRSCTLTISILLCLWPLLVFRFGQITWIGILASFIETPIITVYVWTSLILWPLLSGLAYWGEAPYLLYRLQDLYRGFYQLSLKPVQYFSQFPPWQIRALEAPYPVRPVSLALSILITLFLLCLFYRYEINDWLARNRSKSDQITPPLTLEKPESV